MIEEGSFETAATETVKRRKRETPSPEAPYRGIEPFRYIDREIFFQREHETQKLLRLIVIHRGVLIYGESGAGKSSLINAGLIPLVEDEGFCPDRLRVRLDSLEPLVVERIPLNVAGTKYLPSTFAADEEQEYFVLSLKQWKETLKSLPANVRPLLIFDQFEEVITLFEEAHGKIERSEAIRVQEEIFSTLRDVLRDHSLRAVLPRVAFPSSHQTHESDDP